jgi:glutamate racemase
VAIVDSAEATAATLTDMLDASSTALERPGSLQILVTDLPDQFSAAASRFLGKPVQGLDIRAIDL